MHCFIRFPVAVSSLNVDAQNMTSSINVSASYKKIFISNGVFLFFFYIEVFNSHEPMLVMSPLTPSGRNCTLYI